MLKTIKLYGEMRTLFGKLHTLDVATPAEAVRALCVTQPGFREYLQDRLDAPFRVLVGSEGVDELGLTAPVGCTEVIKFIPVVSGAKDGLGQILMGAAILAAVFYTGGMAGAGFSLTAAAGNWLSAAAISVGTAMVLGGVAGLLAKTPESIGSGLDLSKDAETWAFSSPTLTTGQGGCVPLLYGTMRIGGHVISAGLDAQTWGVGGFDPAVCITDDGTRYGNGDTTPWLWAKAEA